MGSNSESTFSAGFTPAVEACKAEIQELYLTDQVPWVIGYSGGKDSTAILQLIWLALSELEPKQCTKPVHVISTDTLVENPVVATWVARSLEAMHEAASEAKLPFVPHRLTPEITNTFWVNLIGRGYPAPRNKFRWCTERLKISPSNRFIRDMVRDNGEAILVLGTRKAESSKRAANMAKHEKHAVRARLTPNANLPNCLIYTPIESWQNDDVWTFLMRLPNPWGYRNKDLLTMYQGASEDGECPLVVDSTTPSCGNSRFGCWVCTLVDQDKSMAAMIQNDEEKEWMLPLLELRNKLDFRGDDARELEKSRRDYRRITGKLTYYTNFLGEPKLVPVPYKQSARETWLRELFRAQRWIRQNGPDYVREIDLITQEELHEIRRIWVVDKHEIEDCLPRIYEEEMGEPYPGPTIDDNLVFDPDALELLHELCEENEMHFEMVRNMLDVERRYRTMAARRGLFTALEDEIQRCFYDDEQDALERASARNEVKTKRYFVREGSEEDVSGTRTTDGTDQLPLPLSDSLEQTA